MSPPASKDLSDLLALLAHDLRNPLAALLANINFLRSALRERTPEVQEALGDSALSCAVLGQFMGNLDVLGRLLIDAPPASAPVNLRQIASDAMARFAGQITMAGVEIQFAPGPALLRVLAESRWISRAFDNVIANSLQYAPPRSKVSIELAVRDDRGCLAVLDDGPVVADELRTWVFSAGAQAQAKQRFDARYGRGLGLYCAAEAARLAGAEISMGERQGRSVLELTARLAT